MAKESDAVAIFRISERHRTLRTTVIMAGAVLAIGIIATAVVKIMDKPWWEPLIATVGTTVATVLAGQYGLFRYLSERFKRYTSLNQRRVVEMEKERDPERSSSGLLHDGTTPPGDLP